MTDEDHGEERDPLLVRPYLQPDADGSTQTWPAATTREVRSHRALEGASDPTVIIPVVPPEATRRRVPRRLLVVLAACAAVLLGVAAAGFAAIRATRPAITAAQPDAPIPALTGLVPATSATRAGAAASPPAGATATPTHRPATHRSSTATATSPKSTGKASAGEVSGKTGSPSTAIAPRPPSPLIGTIRGQNGLCLDLSGGVAVAFNQIQVATCNGTAAQTWTLATDGTLRVQGMCALIVGDDTVHIITCDTRTTAQWRADGQLLINAANGECLTDPSGGAQSGTAVKVATCGGSAGQRWSLP